MTDEAKALVERLRRLENITRSIEGIKRALIFKDFCEPNEAGGNRPRSTRRRQP